MVYFFEKHFAGKKKLLIYHIDFLKRGLRYYLERLILKIDFILFNGHSPENILPLNF